MEGALQGGSQSLCFNKEEFMKDGFIVDTFIIGCRRRVAMETLRDDLNIHLKSLQSAMIELINKDYADFVNLSSNLVGLDNAINSLTTPLSQMKDEIVGVKTSLDEALKQVEEKTHKQALIRKKKATLQLLMNCIRSVEKIEVLLGINSSNSSSSTNQTGELSGHLVERVASEFNKLQFYVTQSKDLPLVAEIKPRIANITCTLQFSLEKSFLEGLESRQVQVLHQCLRTYATIDKIKDAENLFRQHVVKPYMEQVIGEEQLQSQPQGLQGLYNHILEFIPRHCGILKEAMAPSSKGDEAIHGYDFLVNAVWPEIVSNIEARIPSIFAPGNPAIFHEKYKTSLTFVEQFEYQCGSQASVKRLRGHPSYNTFLSRWSLPVYFQIRYQEIAGALETALQTPFKGTPEGSAMQLEVSQTLVWSLYRCWESSIYLQPLCHRFWKLSLQLLSRYATWLQDVKENVEKQQQTAIQMQTSASTSDLMSKARQTDSPDRASPDIVPNSSTASLSAFIASTHNISNLQMVKLVADVENIARQLPEYFTSQIKPRFSQMGLQDFTIFEECIKECQQSLMAFVPVFGDEIVEDVTRQCIGHLKQVSGIPRLYRKTNREIPSKASSYLIHLMQPVLHFLEEQKAIIAPDIRNKWLQHILSKLAKQYLSATSDVLTSVKKMEESLKRLKKSKAQNTANHGGLSDDDKIRLQIYLDVKEFENQIIHLGLKSSDVDSFSNLLELVTKAKKNDTQ